MLEPDIPLNEHERLSVLERYRILDTPPEKCFDDITWLATQIADTPIALISLIDRNRQWFKSKQGLAVNETPRKISFCGHAIHGRQPFIVPNALEDQRFADNPLVVNDPKIRFYLGLPLTTPAGFNLGTLCVIDRKPRTFSDTQIEMLSVLSRQVVSQLELRLAGKELAESLESSELVRKTQSRFLANMSHEVRTPMNAILGLTEQIIDATPTGGTRDNLEIIKSSAESLLQLLTGILDLSKIEAGRLEIESRPFNLRERLEAAMASHKAAAEKKGVKIEFEAVGDFPDEIVGDPIRLEQILSQLLDNAVKFTEKGVVTLSVKVDQTQDETVRLDFLVKDTGIGISPEMQSMVFEHFSQVDNSDTRIHGGIGLGLAIAARLTGMLGGEITLDSVPGKGSVFTVRLPFKMFSEESCRSENDPRDLLNNLCNIDSVKFNAHYKALLVEDNRINQMVASHLLERMGLEVQVAGNGKIALEAVKERQFDIIFMDLQMPVMDGFQATAEIRKMEAGKKGAPIVAMTAHALKADQDRCRAVGMDGYITKPIDRTELFQVVTRILANGN